MASSMRAALLLCVVVAGSAMREAPRFPVTAEVGKPDELPQDGNGVEVKGQYFKPLPAFLEGDALRFVWLSGAAYCFKGIGNWTCAYCNGTKLEDAQVFESKAKNVRGYVGWDRENKQAVVAFRGTEPSSFENWLENLDAGHTKWPEPVPHHDGTGRVHSGFQESYKSVRDQVFDLLHVLADKHAPRASDDLRIVLTGHSLGGALATLAAFELRSDGFDVDAIWTFGSPRVGDELFAAEYASMLGNVTFRLTHAHDIVPSVPVRVMGYHHVPTEVFYDKDGVVRVCDGTGEDAQCSYSEWTHTSVMDHLYYIDTYICGCNL